MDSLLPLEAEAEPDLIDWRTLDGTEQPSVTPDGRDSSTKTSILGSREREALLGNGGSDDGSDNTVDIDDWEGLPWYQKPSVREPFSALGFLKDKS